MHGGTFAGYARRREHATSRPALAAVFLAGLVSVVGA